MHLEAARQEKVNADFLSGGGEMGERMRSLDWSKTAVGPVENWPQSLRTSVSTCLNSRFAILVWWGKELTKIYNDAYRLILGRKHPQALGAPGKEVWPEIWHIIGPMLEGVLQRGEATWSDNLLLELERDGYPEELYFTFSYSPIRDESGGIGGIFTPVQETTGQVIGERRLRTLRDLAEAARLSDVKTADEVCRIASQTLAKNSQDIPFAAFYLLSEDGREARLCGTAGFGGATVINPRIARLGYQPEPWVFANAIRTASIEVVSLPPDVASVAPCGAWPAPPHEAVVLPLTPAGQHAGALIVGVSPRKKLNGDYLSFLSLVSGHVTTAIAEVRAFEEERKRAAALAELDRAKTAFFSNVSHEFRTPLTLMLGPLEEILEMDGTLPPEAKELAAITHRNGLRLQRLVNTLLEFSRIEAGRMEASYEPTDLASLTAELASTFHSAMEKGGLQFMVDCPPLGEPVYVDQGMWEKVVLNLLSNAYKYTLKGQVTVRLTALDGCAVLAIQDTGVGIPEREIPLLFERFHRVEGTSGRTQEGTGIGLALVAELVRLHSGTVEVQSALGQGSTFKVSIPLGERVGAVPKTIRESVRWAPMADSAGSLESGSYGSGARVLIADDNADMRGYLTRLLADRYRVTSVANGKDALASVLQDPPDVVLTDVMMPELDGFGLLQTLRSKPETSVLPVILLSARAGEEARVEGLDAGASDYLVKPFTARELLARVGAHIETARLRKQAAEREAKLRAAAESARDEAVGVLESITDGFFALDHDWRFTYVNATGERLMGASRQDLLGQDFWVCFAPTVGTIIEREFRRALSEQVAVEFEAFYEPWQRWFAVKAYPTQQGGISVYFRETSEQKRTHEQLRAIFDGTYEHIGLLAPDGTLLEANRSLLEFAGNSREEVVGRPFWEGPWFAFTAGAPEAVRAGIERAAGGEFVRFEATVQRPSGDRATFDISFHPVRNERGEVILIVPEGRDITQSKQAEEALRQSDARLRAALEASATGTFSWDISTDAVTWDYSLDRLFGLEPGQAVRSLDQFLARVHPDDRQRVIDVCDRCRTEGADFELEFRVPWPDGSEHWLYDRGQTLRDERSRPVYMTGACVDITTRKHAEMALRASEERFRAAVQVISDVLWTNNARGEMEGEQPGWGALTGQTKEEYQGFGWSKAVHPDDAQPTVEAWNKAVAAQSTFLFEHRVRRHDGVWRLFSIRAVPVLDEHGAIREWVGIHNDITEERNLLTALQQSEARFRQLADAMPQIVWTANPNGEKDYYNQRWFEFTDAGIEQILHPDDVQYWQQAWKTSIASGIPYRAEYRLWDRHEHRWRWFLSRALPVRDEAGKIIKWFGASTDIDEQKRTEAELRRANQDLEQFAYSASHDLQEPLRSVSIYSELLAKRYKDRLDAQGLEFLGYLKSGANRMQMLIHDLLAYTQISSHDDKPPEKPVDANRLLQSVTDNLSAAIRDSGAQISFEPLPSVPLHAVHLQQLLQNLIGNGIKYRSAEAPRIHLAAEKHGDQWLFSVRDNGIGIDPEYKERIFGIFKRLHTGDEYSGTGIGLAVCQRIVERYGGRIWVESQPGKGSTFYFTLPA